MEDIPQTKVTAAEFEEITYRLRVEGFVEAKKDKYCPAFPHTRNPLGLLL